VGSMKRPDRALPGGFLRTEQPVNAPKWELGWFFGWPIGPALIRLRFRRGSLPRNEFESHKRRGIPDAETGFDDPRIPAGPVLEPGRHVIKQLGYDRLASEKGQRQTARRQPASLAQRDHFLRETAYFLGFRFSGFNPLMVKQRRHHAAKQSPPVVRVAPELAPSLSMSHVVPLLNFPS
jgi:hypothetical protein